MEVHLLGPLEVVGDDGVAIDLPGGKPRLLLALLALEEGRVVSAERIVDGLWGDQPPGTAAKIVLGYVSRLRKLLPAGLLETKAPGYRLRLGGGRDLDRFETLRREAARAASEGRRQAAATLLADALSLWRGPALADVADELRLPGELARLEELRLVTLEDRIEADLALGREAELVAELEAMVEAHPLRERPRALLMLALYRIGRQADALTVYRETRHLLVEELGIEPGEELQRLERQILVHDAELASPVPADRLPPLPAALTPLVGRMADLAGVNALLQQPAVRLVTLVGPGGVGKTRLALAVAEPRPEAVFVSLAPVQDAERLRATIAEALGLKDETMLEQWLRQRELLLVLDNFEQVVEAAPVVTGLLAAAPGLTVIATSREPLDVSGEHRYTVGPLSEDDAVDLFIERAAATDVEVERADVLAAICRRLDCLPLAIELAASRANVLPPEELLARLEQRLPLLTHGPRDLPERQRTLRATIEWSFALLEPPDQTAFARLSIYAGGCTLASAEQVCELGLEELESLVDKSLLRHDGRRFTMLETIREYAAERLDASGEAAVVTGRLAEQLTEAGEAFSAASEGGENPSSEPLEEELDNIRAVLRASLSAAADAALALAAVLAWFWTVTGRYAEGLRWTVDALERGGGSSPAVRAEALRAAARLATLSADAVRGRVLGEEALALFRAAGDDLRAAEVLRWLANANMQAGEAERARSLHAESIALHEQLGNPLRLARALRVAGEDELELGDATRAGKLFRRALLLAGAVGDLREMAMTLHGLGDVCLGGGDLDGAAGFYREALRSSANADVAVNCLAGLAAVAARRGQLERAARVWGALESHQEQLGERLILPQTRRRYEAALSEIQGGELMDAVDAGRSLTLELAVQEAL